MPRKKVTRSKLTKNSSSKVKKRVKQVVSSLSEAMERDFKHLPKQLPIQFRKDIAVLKQRESKLAATIKKMEKQKKAAKSDMDLLSAKLKEKSTLAAKKQLKALTTEFSQINQMISSLNFQLKQTNKQIDILSHKQAKFTALSKEISKLDKEWEKKKFKNDNSKKPTRKKRLNNNELGLTSSENTQPNNQTNVSIPETIGSELPIEESQEA